MDNPEGLSTRSTQDIGQINVRKTEWTINNGQSNRTITRERDTVYSRMDNPEVLSRLSTQDTGHIHVRVQSRDTGNIEYRTGTVNIEYTSQEK